MDGVDEAAQLELYAVADRQPMQLDGRRDMVGATQAEHESRNCEISPRSTRSSSLVTLAHPHHLLYE